MRYEQERKKKKRRRYIAGMLLRLSILALAVTGILVLAKTALTDKKPSDKETVQADAEADTQKEAEKAGYAQLIEEADVLAAGYDYDAAIAMVQSYEGYEEEEELRAAIEDYEAKKAECVLIKPEEVTHIFYHSLVVDADRAFANQETDHQAAGNNQWMTTVDEFNKITQTMYDEGYVLVDLHDLVTKTTEEDGTVRFSEGTILLPPGKKAYVLSMDDLSYYHAYDNYGFASKMVLDENGKPKCEYTQADGTTVVGDYDVVPLLDTFMEAHPDGAYHGARGTIALTGYNGVLGYRTDISYETRPDDLYADKRRWLEAHPDFDLEKERTEAKKVADAMKAEGWVFASHTWGHLRVGSSSLALLQEDNERWKENIEPIVGSVDTLIFAHGEDFGDWGDYALDNEKFQYYKSQGYRFFCGVDAHPYRVHIGGDYMRQARRNLDGYRLYQNVIGNQDNLSDLFSAAEIIDPKRPPVLPLN